MENALCACYSESSSSRPAPVLNPPYHKYTELLLSSVPEMDPDWLDDLLAKRAAAG